MSVPIPSGVVARIVALSWEGRARSCPACGNVFTSTRDSGRCQTCGNRFRASEIYGAPPELTEEEIRYIATTVTDEQSTRILELLIERMDELPKRPKEFECSEYLRHSRSEIELWDFEDALLRQSLANGGELWRWSTSPESWEAMCGRAGVAVIQDGRVTACKQTAMN